MATPTAAKLPLDEAIDSMLRTERASIPGFVRHAREVLARPDWEQSFFARCRQVLYGLVGAGDGGVVQICSPGRGEGRSSVAAAFALLLCQTYTAGVALLDLDFSSEGGGQARMFGIEPWPGLADYLEQREPLRGVLGGPERQLCLVPAGRHYQDPSRLYRRVIADQVVECFRRRFQWVVMDMPPLLEDLTASRLTGRADWRVLLGRYRQTTLADLEEALSLLVEGPATAFLLTSDSSPVPGWIRRLL